MSVLGDNAGPHVGDWVEVRGVSGQPAKRGQIVELLGRARHERFRIRWDETRESILYPADGVRFIPGSEDERPRKGARSRAAR